MRRVYARHSLYKRRTNSAKACCWCMDCNMGLVRSRLCIITVKWNESYATARDLCVVFLLIGINMSLFKLSLTHSRCIYKQQQALTNGRHAMREFTRRTVQYIHPLLIYTLIARLPRSRAIRWGNLSRFFDFSVSKRCRARTLCMQKKIFVFFYENKTDDDFSMGGRSGEEGVAILHRSFRFLCSRYICDDCCMLTIYVRTYTWW